jgi:hypothetical protein
MWVRRERGGEREEEDDVKRGEPSLSPPSSNFILFIWSFVVFIVPVIYEYSIQILTLNPSLYLPTTL